jgi:hypothetical protein
MTPAHMASSEGCASAIVRDRLSDAREHGGWLFAATGDERTVTGDPHARYFGTELHGDELTPGDGARIGAIDFATSFATHPQGARR